MSGIRASRPAAAPERSDAPLSDVSATSVPWLQRQFESPSVGDFCSKPEPLTSRPRDLPLLFLNPDWRIAYDRHQWIVQRCDDRARRRWRGVSFPTQRDSLLRIIKEKRIAADEEALAMIPSWPATHLLWFIKHKKNLRESKAEVHWEERASKEL